MFVDQLLHTHVKGQVERDGLDPGWIPVVLSMCSRMFDKLRVHPSASTSASSDLMDLRAYVKIKKLAMPGGNLRNSQYVDGVVFKRNVTHKGMRQNISRPKVCPGCPSLSLSTSSLFALLN